jgi:hypothetical protein
VILNEYSVCASRIKWTNLRRRFFLTHLRRDIDGDRKAKYNILTAFAPEVLNCSMVHKIVLQVKSNPHAGGRVS